MMTGMIALSVGAWLWPVAVAAYAAAIIGVTVIIVADNGNPVRSLAWMAVVVLLPVIGVAMYFFLGRDLKGTRVVSRRKKRRLVQSENMTSAPRTVRHLGAEANQLIKLGHATSHAAYYPDNDIKLYDDGKSFFDDLKVDLRQATTYINIQYYIFANDRIGTEIAEILMAKAAEGVKVRLLYDHVGCIDVPASFFRHLEENGVAVEPFFKIALPKFFTTLNWRNHRKGVIIDGRIGYIGGMNVADRYITGGDSFGHWRDTSVRFTGPGVAALQLNFAIDWNFMERGLLDDKVSGEPRPTEDSTPDVGVQIIAGGPTERYSGIALTYFKAIAMARKRVLIQTPYFLPNAQMLAALQGAALAGADVRVMMPRQTDSKILAYASRSYISECVGAGIKFYLYEKGMLHAKVLIIDDEISTVGSANFDYRSFEHNFEENIVMYSTEMNERMVRQFDADQAECTRVIPRQWHRRPRMERVRESLCRLLSPLL